jgi:hypothetical protein
MQTLVNFFTLRPTFTFFGAQIVWYIYLTNVVIQTYNSISNVLRILAQRGVHVDLWSAGWIPLLLGIIAQLLIVRLLIEVAAIIISDRGSRS